MKPVSSPSVRPATTCSTVFECPPARSSRSNSSTSWRFESAYAAPRPEIPVPTTAIFVLISRQYLNRPLLWFGSMARYVTTVESALPQAEAFAYMADFANARLWDPSVREARRVGEAPIGIGYAFDLVARFGGRDVPLRSEIV